MRLPCASSSYFLKSQDLSLFLPTVKWLCYILAVYFLGLSFITCADDLSNNSSTENQQVVMSSDSHSGHDNGSSSNDLCNPICSCHCCHIHVIFPNAMSEANPLGNPSHYPFYHQNFKSLDLFELFIPPRA